MTARKPDTYTQARLEVMHYILEFCLTHCASGEESAEHPRMWPGVTGFVRSTVRNPAQPGDLVVFSSMRSGSKWQIGWLQEATHVDLGGRWLISSLEDRALCWVENVGISYFPRDKLQAQWRWTDAQHALAQRWYDVAYKKHDAYIAVPLPPVFEDGGGVTLGVRTRFGWNDARPTRSYPDWRKVTKEVLSQCYLDCSAERQQLADAAKKKESVGE